MKIDLGENEKVLWEGRAGAGLFVPQHSVISMIFGVTFTALVISFLVVQSGIPASASANASIPLLIVVAIPFLVGGLYLAVGQFLVDAWLRARTTYIVTDMRILIHRAAPFASLKTINLDDLPDLTLIEHADGLGTIRFAPAQEPFRITFGVPDDMPSPVAPEFVRIARPHDALAIVKRAAQARRISKG